MIRQITEWYENRSPVARALIKTAGLYASISLGGNVVEALTEKPTLDTLIDMSAPVL